MIEFISFCTLDKPSCRLMYKIWRLFYGEQVEFQGRSNAIYVLANVMAFVRIGCISCLNYYCYKSKQYFSKIYHGLQMLSRRNIFTKTRGNHYIDNIYNPESNLYLVLKVICIFLEKLIYPMYPYITVFYNGFKSVLFPRE